MSTGDSSLLRAFERHAGGPLVGAPVEAEQLDLLRDEKGNLPKNVFALAREQARRPGRPPNAPNKRNDTIAKLVCQEAGDPVLWMARLYAMPLDQLIELLLLAEPAGKQAKRGDIAIKALNLQLAAAKESAGFVHSRKPVDVAVTARLDGVMIMPGRVAPGETLADVTAQQKLLADKIAEGLASGTLAIEDLSGKKLVDGQIVDADWSPVDDDVSGGE